MLNYKAYLDELILLTISFLYIFINSFIGFVSLFIYFIWLLVKRDYIKLIIPTMYLAINSTLGGFNLFSNVSHFQVFATLTMLFFLSYSEFRKVLVRLIQRYLLIFFSIFFIILLSTFSGGIRIFASLCFFFVMILIICANDGYKNFLKYLVYSANQIAYIAILELLLHKTFFYSGWTGEERYRFGILRVGSTVSDPNYICICLVPIAILCFYIYKSTSEKRFLFNTVLLGFVSFITFSRTGWISMAIAIVLMFRRYYYPFRNFFHNKYFKIFFISILSLLLILFLTFFVFFPSNTLFASNFTRILCIKYGLQIFIKHSFIGIGLNNFYEYAQPLFYKEYGGHFLEGISVMNTPMEILLTFGIIGFICFGYIICLSFVISKKYWNYLPPFFEMIVCFLIMSLTLDTITCGFFWILFSMPLCHMNNKTHDLQHEAKRIN